MSVFHNISHESILQCLIQNTKNRWYWNDIWYVCVCETETDKIRQEITRRLKENISEKGQEADIMQTGRYGQWLRRFLVQQRNALILCLLHLLLRFGQHPKLMVIIIAVTLHRLCWYRRAGAVWRRLHKHCSCLTKRAFSYGSEMSGVTPINGGQENTEGLCCCLRRDESSFKVVYLLPLIICLAKLGFACQPNLSKLKCEIFQIKSSFRFSPKWEIHNFKVTSNLSWWHNII